MTCLTSNHLKQRPMPKYKMVSKRKQKLYMHIKIIQFLAIVKVQYSDVLSWYCHHSMLWGSLISFDDAFWYQRPKIPRWVSQAGLRGQQYRQWWCSIPFQQPALVAPGWFSLERFASAWNQLQLHWRLVREISRLQRWLQKSKRRDLDQYCCK